MECIACGKQFYTWSGRDSSDWQNKFCSLTCLEKYQNANLNEMSKSYGISRSEIYYLLYDADRSYLTTHWPSEDKPNV